MVYGLLILYQIKAREISEPSIGRERKMELTRFLIHIRLEGLKSQLVQALLLGFCWLLVGWLLRNSENGFVFNSPAA